MRRAPDVWSYAALAALALVWGHAFLFMKIAGSELSPEAVAAARAAIGGLAVAGVALLLARAPPRRSRVYAFSAWIGLVGVAAPFALLAFATQRVPSGVVGVYMSTVALFVAPLAHVLSPALRLDDRLTPTRAFGLGVGAVGVACVFGLDTLLRLGDADAIGQLAALAAALCYAVASISIRAMPEGDPIPVAGIQLGVGALLLAPFILPGAAAAPDWSALSWAVWAALLALSVAATGFAMVLRVYVIATVGSIFLSSVGYLVTLVALFAGWAFAGESFSAADLLGAALIVLGVAIAQGLLKSLSLRRDAAR